jgi:RNA polymerase primary sigma factor
MDAPFETGESSTLYTVIQSMDSTSPDAELMRESLNLDMNQALKSLSSRESEVIRLFYGLGERNPKSLNEIGELFDLTRERVRQIREKAIRRLRSKSHNQVLQSYL